MVLKVLTKPELDIYLAHYGKKGMRWGIRKARAQRLDNDGKSKTDSILKKLGNTRLSDIYQGNKIRRAEKKAPIKIENARSSVTKDVIKDYNSMTNGEFFKKYVTPKRTYKKRVDKYGDPFLRSKEKILKKRGFTP